MLVTLVVPDEADAEDAAGVVADAAVSTALEVVAAAGVEGHLLVPGSLVVLRDGVQPLWVEWGVRGKRDLCRSGRQLGQDATHRPGSGPVAVTRADVPPGPGRVDRLTGRAVQVVLGEAQARRSSRIRPLRAAGG